MFESVSVQTMGNYCFKSEGDTGGDHSKARRIVPPCGGGDHRGHGKAAAASGARPAIKSFSYQRILAGANRRTANVGFPASPTSPSAVVVSTDPNDYQCVKQSKMTWVRTPGTINDQRVTVEDCTDCQIVVADQCDSLQVDDCTSCTFYVGPTAGSVFLRKCVGCTFILACGQLRTRDLTTCRLSLYCSTRPVIETSRDLSIACYHMPEGDYFEFRQHMAKAKLSVMNNRFRQVHDFTPNFDKGGTGAATNGVASGGPDKSRNYRIVGRREALTWCAGLTALTDGAVMSTGDWAIPYSYGSLDDVELRRRVASHLGDGEASSSSAAAATNALLDALTVVVFKPDHFDDAEGFLLTQASPTDHVVMTKEAVLTAELRGVFSSIDSLSESQLLPAEGQVVLIAALILPDARSKDAFSDVKANWGLYTTPSGREAKAIVEQVLVALGATDGGFGHALT